MIKELHSKMPQLEKYRLAWAALRGTCCNKAAHAKCWLTYRAYDGEVTFDDWKKHVETVSIQLSESNYRVRWNTSINTATFYLATIQGDKERAEQAAQQVLSANLDEYPGALLSWCRVNAILAQDALQRGDDNECRTIIKMTFTVWQRVMGQFNPAHYPVRFVEAIEDMRVLHTLMTMAQKVGVIHEKVLDQDWLKPHEKDIQRNRIAWLKCLRHVRIRQHQGPQLRIVCVLKSGGEYNARHVHALRDMCLQWMPEHKFICLTDAPDLDCDTLPLRSNLKGWWSKLELFDVFTEGNTLFMDLDTVIRGPCTEILDRLMGRSFVIVRDFYRMRTNRTAMGSCVIFWNGNYRWIFEMFLADRPEKKLRGDQDFLEQAFTAKGQGVEYVQDITHEVCNFMAHIRDQSPPSEAAIVCFHGKPRPWDQTMVPHPCSPGKPPQ
jgi:hypothetical protein